MLNEDKIKLMTGIAMFEIREGKRIFPVNRYFRSDYIAAQVLKSIICAVLAFAIVFGIYMLCNYETFLQELYTMDLFAFAKNVLTYLCSTVAGYGVLTYVVCTWRYAKVKKSLKCYYHNLKKLNSLYNEMQ